jgi:hypothetical protein
MPVFTNLAQSSQRNSMCPIKGHDLNPFQRRLKASHPTFPMCWLLTAELGPSPTAKATSWASKLASRGSSIDGTEFLGLVSGVRITFERFSVDHGRTSPAALPSIRCAPCSCRERRGSWSEPVDPPQDLGEQGARHRYLGHLEHHIAAVAHEPGADLDELLAQRGQRPMLAPPDR